MDGRCISQNELAQRWQISEATLERWRSQRKGPQFLRLGGQVHYRLVDVESYERESLEVFGTVVAGLNLSSFSRSERACSS
jgi:predicted DNA-binding transcriptional regulator AlpA